MTTISSAVSMIARRTDLLFSFFFLLVVSMLILPLPTILVDAMIGFNLAFAFIVLVTTIYLKNALELSTFPAVILIGTIFRLALTISTTRLILAEGDAGDIIKAFGSFVVSGNLIVGLVIFLIVALVQFIVVTKGAERIAEVGARFTLDAMPGKQLAIDSDLRNGHVTPDAARARRQQLEQESQFFGAMDGAMRFVKGDAIAGLVIVAVNLIGGLAIGIFQHGMSFSESAGLYSLLSVGDGLVSQIPSMLMAIAAGTVVTRVSSDESGSLGSDIGHQLSRDPRALAVAAAMTFAISFVPGFPAPVLWPIGILLGAIAFTLHRNSLAPATSSPASRTDEGNLAHQPLDRTKYGDPIIATLSSSTFQRLQDENLGGILESSIRQAARAIGVAVTVPTFNVDPRIEDDLIHVQVENTPAGLIPCKPDQDVQKIAESLTRIVRRHVGLTFSVDDVADWLAGLEPRLGRLAIEVREQVPPMTMVAVMRRLLDSGVTVSQPRGLLETVLAISSRESNPEVLADIARQALGKQVAYGLLDHRGVLPAIALGPEWERAVRSLRDAEGRQEVQKSEETIRWLAKECGELLLQANATNRDPVALTDASIRFMSQGLLIQHGCRIPVLSPADIDDDITCEMVGTLPDKGS